MAKNTPGEARKTMIKNLPEKTGKSLTAWQRALGKQGFTKHGEIVKWLKAEHGVTHGFANLIAQTHLTPSAAAGDLVAAQYAGAKRHLQPIYEAVVKTVGAFGDDVEISPKKTYVSLRRKKQFALVQASTKDRVDIGINLAGAAASGRLEKAGSFNAMVSHRIRITHKSEIDKELRQWLKAAYDAA